MPDLQIGSTFAGYQIEAVAARGGMGVVYRASQIRPARTVALKVIAPGLAEDPEYRERFQRESEIASAIEHPNVIPIYDAQEHDGVLFIAMRWVEGTNLSALIAEHGRLAPERAAEIIDQVAAALDAAHARGLVHRDIKPANVLIDQSGSREHVYLTDFGVARQMDAQTMTGGVGTIDYMSPEQLTGAALDGRTDVYGLGCLLYRALTGEVPYPGANEVAKMRAHVEAPPPRPSTRAPDVPAAFDTVIARALAKDPDRRYPTAGELAQAANDAASGQAPITAETRAAAPPTAAPAAPPPAAEQPPPPGRRRPLLLVAGSLLAIAAGAAIAATALPGGSDKDRGGGSGAPVIPGTRPAPATTGPSTQPTTTAPAPTTTTTSPSTTPEPSTCSVTDDAGKSWTLTIKTPKTTTCSEATQVWTQYQGQVAKTHFDFQQIGAWGCSPRNCMRGAPTYSSFDATPA